MIPALLLLQLVAAEPPVSVEADSSSYNLETRRVHLEGNVRVTRPPYRSTPALEMQADEVDGYLDGPIRVKGNMRFISGEFDVRAEEGEYDVSSSTGFLDRVSTVKDSIFITAERVEVAGPDEYIMRNCRVTTCDRHPDPHYHVRVSRATYRNQILRAYGSTLYLGKIPILWIPFIPFVPGAKKPPFHVRVGRSGYEGPYVKMAYPYAYDFFGVGSVKLDYRSRRGWAYGVENTNTLPQGWLHTDLYRVEERDRGGRGVARFKYQQDWRERWTARGDIYYLTDGRFLEEYRFRDFASDPEPQSTGSVSYRGDGHAEVVRVAANLNRGDYDLVERLPEARVLLTPRRLPAGIYLDGAAGMTVFRHSHPYDSGATTLYFRQHPAEAEARLQEVNRADLNVTAKMPMKAGGSWIVTPYATYLGLAYSEDTGTGEGSSYYRSRPALGVTLAGFERFRVSERISYQIRPVLDASDRSIYGPLPGRVPIIEHTDQVRDQRPLKLILDQGILNLQGRRWVERVRLRVEGGWDFDRVHAEQYLPVTTKLFMLFGPSLNFDGELTVDPNRGEIKDVRAELTHESRRFKTAASYFRRRPTPGLPDMENVSASITGDLSTHWSATIASSYDIEKRRLDFARYSLTRRLHDFNVTIEATDQRLIGEFDVRATVDLVLP